LEARPSLYGLRVRSDEKVGYYKKFSVFYFRGVYVKKVTNSQKHYDPPSESAAA